MLDLYGNNIGNEGAQKIGSLPNLAQLNLSKLESYVVCNSLEAGALEELHLPQLLRLKAGGNKLRALKQNLCDKSRHLEELELGSCILTKRTQILLRLSFPSSTV